MTTPQGPADPWHGFVDDRGLIPDRAATLPHPSPYVGARVVSEDDLFALTTYGGPLRIELSGGAGMVATVTKDVRQVGNRVVALDLTVRDVLGPAHNVRRFLAAADDVDLPEEIVLHVGMAGPPSGSWLAAADELAATDHALLLDLDSPDLEAWIDAALDRELRFAVRGGTVEQAVGAVLTTARLWGDPDDVAAGRRWCRSWVTGWRQTEDAITYLEGLS